MKTLIKYICKLTSVLIAAGFLFNSCSNLIGDIDDSAMEAKSGNARISFAVGLKGLGESSQSSRTVMAKADDNKELSTLKEIKFYKKLSSDSQVLGSTGTLVAAWDTYDAMLLSPFSDEVASGSYDFMLTAKNYGTTMTQTITDKVISSGTSVTLNFTSLEADSKGNQTGVIDLTLNYHPYNDISDDEFKKYVSYSSSPYFALSIAVDSTVVVTKDSTKSGLTSSKSSYSSTLDPDENGNAYSIGWQSTKFVSAPVNAGFHVVTFTFTAPDNSVFVYPVAVDVQACYLTKDTLYPFKYNTKSVTKDSESNSHTITYNSNTTSSSIKTQVFYEGSSIADADALGFEAPDSNKRFKEWNTKADGSGSTYKAGDLPALNGDITLYAQWAEFKKITYIINVEKRNVNPVQMRDETYIQQYESGNSLVSMETAFAVFAESNDYNYYYTFCGWDTEADGSGTRYAAGASPSLSEDTILYGQWCGVIDSSYKNGYYHVENVNQWNAIMGAPFAVTGNIINVDIYLKNSSYSAITITNPALNLTSGKTFAGNIYTANATISGLSGALFNEIAEGSEITNIKISAPVAKTNRGKIASCTANGFTLTGNKSGSSDGYAGAICYENYGTISDCIVNNCTIDGNTNSLMYTGGICGYNKGTISGDSTKVTGTVKGKSSGESYTGGYCGYNNGTIEGKGSVDITLSGSDDASGYYGYVIGKNASGNVSTEITCAQSERTEKPETTVNDWTAYELKLTRTSKVCVFVTDSVGDGKMDCSIQRTSSGWNKSSCITYIEDVKESTEPLPPVYLEKGTYYIYLREDYLGKCKGSVAWTID